MQEPLGTDLNYLNYDENIIGANHPLLLDDTINRPVKELCEKFDLGLADVQVPRTHIKIDSATEIEATVVNDDIVYLNQTTGKYEKSFDTQILGIIDVDNLMVYTFGMTNLKSTTLTPGEKYYLNTSTPGAITTNDISGIFIGTAYGTDKILNVAVTVGSLFSLIAVDTDNVPEGDLNLYYTDDRVNAKVENIIDIPRSKLYKGTIPDLANLNTYITSGIYHQPSNTSAVSGTNYPVSYLGMLEVFADSSIVYQTYHSYQEQEGLYYRARYNVTWSAWTKVSSVTYVGQQIATRAAIASPGFTGTPTAPTAPVGTSSTQLATTEFATPRTSVTGASFIPSGTTAQRPVTAYDGYIRYNTSLTAYEGYNAGVWTALGGGATGSSQDKIFYLNGQTVTSSYTIPVGQNAMTAGPITVNSGITVTVSTNTTWSIV